MKRLMALLAVVGWGVVSVPAEVRLEPVPGGARQTRDGQPYFIKGAGGKQRLAELAACGGNSIRTWGTDHIQPILDEAHSNGLSVTVGYWVGHERHGFNYNDPAAVKEQMDKARAAVLRYKDHPALLMWCMGNEMEGDGKNPAIWKAINDLAKMCKEVDPNHPVMTVIAELGEPKVKMFNEHCPDVDVLGLNTYGGVQSIGERYRKQGGVKPYVVTEFGPPGQWEIPVLPIGTISEFNSTKKAEWYRNAYRDGIEAERPLCLGSYVFIWGFKQEATATWYGLFLKDGARLGAVESMIDAWGGAPPTNRCPTIGDLVIPRDDGWKPGDTMTVTVRGGRSGWRSAHDEVGVAPRLAQPRHRRRRPGGRTGVSGGRRVRRGRPATLKHPGGRRAVPPVRGTYDGRGNAAVANAPFRVEGPEVRPRGAARARAVRRCTATR
jgi:hypothetical protein